MPYTTKVDGNTIIVTLGSQPGADAGQAAAAARAGAGQASAAAAERAIRTIDFRRGADGTGRVIVQLTDPRTPVNVRQEGNQVVVDFAGTLMPKNLMRRYDVMDFATPVQTVDALRVDGSSRLVISAQGDFEQLAYQSDNQYTIEIKPSTKRAAARGEEGIHRRAPDLEFPGHRRALGVAAAGRHQRPEHRGQRFGDGQPDPAPAKRALGSGAGHRAAHQGAGQAPPGQCHHHRPDRGTRRAREGRAGGAQRSAGAVADPHGIHAGQLCQGLGPGETDQAHRRRRRQELHAVGSAAACPSTSAPTPVGAGHVGKAGRHPAPGADLGRARQAGADRGAHRDRQRHLRARPGRPIRRAPASPRPGPAACFP